MGMLLIEFLFLHNLAATFRNNISSATSTVLLSNPPFSALHANKSLAPVFSTLTKSTYDAAKVFYGRSKTMKYFLCALALTLLSGCGLSVQQKSDATRIASATTTAGEFSTQQFTNLRSAIIALQVAYYKVDIHAQCERSTSGVCFVPLDRGVTTDAIDARVALTDALSAYGKALDSLINADHAEELLTAANELGDSLGAAADKSDAFSLSDDDTNAISALTALAGRWRVEGKRKRALRALAASYAKTIQRITPLLENDFQLQWNSPCNPEFLNGRTQDAPRSGPEKPAGLLDIYCQSAYNLKVFSKDIINDSSAEYALRISAVDGYVLAHNAQTNGAIISKNGTALLTQLHQAAPELAKVANNKKYQSADIKALGKDMKTLTSSLKLLIHTDQ